jgi:chromosome segregation ATPase
MNDKLSIVGPAPASTTSDAGDKSAADSKDAAAKPAASADDELARKKAVWKGWQDKLTAQKDSIDLAGRELDVLTREYQIRAAAMYADVGNRMRNAAQWDKQDADYKQKIADKQKSVEEAKQKLEDLKEEARKAGVPSAIID